MREVRTPRRAVPVTVLTGFLGAGKTTLLNRILNGDHGLRIAVLVNDFGAINVDAELVTGVHDDIISLADGCVCCQIRDDLIAAIESVLARPEPVEYVLLEASGVADPSGIFLTLVSDQYRDRIRLDSVTCVVDAEQALREEDHPDFAMLKLRQIGFADLVVLNKTDLAGEARVARTRAWIDAHLNRVRLVEAAYGRVPLEVLLAVGRFDPARVAQLDSAPPELGRAFSTWSYRVDRPLSLHALRTMVKKRLPGSVYRCKGVVYASEAPAQPAVLQVVGRRTDVTWLGEWKGPPRTQIVAIGEPGGVPESTLQREFDSCLADAG